MGILPIGFFSPLPLAMMIPFMATQSLAMGEAFGKSFQYGKRKISSMTNEEFNKLTFHDLMVEQTANIKDIIPQLKSQMAMSQDMQKAIFQEMINLIPTFFESFKKVIPTDLVETSSQASPYPAVQEVRYAGRTKQDLAETQARLDAANKLFYDNFLKQQGTKESLAEKLGRPEPLPTQYTTPAEKRIPSEKVLSAAEDPVYLTWITKLGTLKAQFQAAQAPLKSSGYSNSSPAAQRATLARVKIKTRPITSKIRSMSNDYRHPNNHIRENALRLRANMSQWS